jgi:hypothetical protein
MTKVTVYSYLTWDHQRGRSVTPPMKSTAARIDLVGGRIVPGTGEEVDAAAVDERGCYRPAHRRPGS